MTSTKAPGTPSVGGRTPPHRPHLVLVLLCLSQLMVILDGSIVAVALPVIGTNLQVTDTALAWVVNAYLVPFGGMLLLAGKLGDVLGPRRVLLAGLAVFTAASLACGLAPSIEVLVVARFTQGVGGALASAVVLGMIVTTFQEPAARGRALAVYSFVGAAGSSTGLLAGGLLTEGAGWPWIFLINLPVGMVALVGVRTLVPSPAGTGDRVDTVSAILGTTGLGTVVWVLLDSGASTRTVVLLGVIAMVLLIAFLSRQTRSSRPLLPLRLLANRNVGLGNLVQALMVAGLFGFQFLGALYLEQLLGYRPLRAGLAFLPVPVVIAVVSLTLTGRLVSRFGPRPVVTSGLALVTGGLAFLVGLPAVNRYLTHILPAGLLIAVGFGLAFPALVNIAVASAPPRDAGLASGLFNATQQVGGALGLAALTRLASNTSPTHSVVLSGYHLAFAAAAACTAAALVLSLRISACSPRTGDTTGRVTRVHWEPRRHDRRHRSGGSAGQGPS